MARCTLELGGDLLVAASGGTLDVEYALFDPSDIELSATGPGTIRETGYRTTVGEARARLTNAGLTGALAEQAAAHVVPALARAYARGAAVRHIADRLEAVELFDGRTYDPAAARYAGAWLDTAALASALAAKVAPSRGAIAASVLQGLFLAAALAERPDEAVLLLATAEITAQRRPGERTFRRLQLGDPREWVEGLGAVKGAPRDPASADDGPGRREVQRALRARGQRVPALASRCVALAAALEAREQPARGPLADADLWSLELKLAMGETDGVSERLEAIERQRGRLPATTYLKARVALMAGTEEPRAIAEHVSALSTSMAAFHELQLLAAQAWAAAGDVRRAHAFARDLSENGGACDALRMQAREVLDAAGRAPTAPEGGIPLIPKPPLAPSGTELSVPSSEPPDGGPSSAPSSERWPRGYPRVRSWTADLALPSYRIEPIQGSAAARA
ncbi:MAG: hypothetical protein JOZ69_02295, partial [Myxococcales bacterium]|nr:hypothetical protein [Myxococcales bacterium]